MWLAAASLPGKLVTLSDLARSTSSDSKRMPSGIYRPPLQRPQTIWRAPQTLRRRDSTSGISLEDVADTVLVFVPGHSPRTASFVGRSLDASFFLDFQGWVGLDHAFLASAIFSSSLACPANNLHPRWLRLQP